MIKSSKLLLILIICSSCAWLTGPEGYFPTNEYEFLDETSQAPLTAPENLSELGLTTESIPDIVLS